MQMTWLKFKFFSSLAKLTFVGFFIGTTSAIAETQSAKGIEAFRRNVYEPILQKQCLKCHGNNGPGPNHSSEDLGTSYQMVLRYTNFMDIKNSKFVTKGTNDHGNSYGGQTTITQEELTQALQRWWDQGENTAFLEGKVVLPAQIISNLPQDGNYKTLSWDLGAVDANLTGVEFQIDIQSFITRGEKTGGAYKLKNPRFSTNNRIIEVKSLNVIMNGIWDSTANNYDSVNYVVSTKPNEVATLSSYKQIVHEVKGEGKDQISFAFKTLKLAPPGSKVTFIPDIVTKQTNQASEEVTLSKNPVFDKSIVGKAGHFVKIKATVQNPIEFEMGSPATQKDRYDYNEKLHKVRLTKAFEIQSTDVTQLQWYMVMKDTDKATPSNFKEKSNCDTGNFMSVKTTTDAQAGICKNHPVEKVSWDDVKEFIKKLNTMQNTYTYRLPTEAEWEYVAKAGLPAEYSYGWGSDFDGSYAWFYGNSKNQTHEVGTRQGVPSPQDLNDLMYDMSGNVWQWVEDWFDANYGLTPEQLKVTTQDPQGLSTAGSDRVMRGGSWGTDAQNLLRSGDRYGYDPGSRDYDVGLRLVRTGR